MGANKPDLVSKFGQHLIEVETEVPCASETVVDPNIETLSAMHIESGRFEIAAVILYRSLKRRYTGLLMHDDLASTCLLNFPGKAWATLNPFEGP